MTFEKALRLSPAKRDEFIENWLYEQVWESELESHMRAGGFPSDASVDEVTIEESEDDIVVSFSISFTECVLTGCKNCTYDTSHRSPFILTISKSSGEYELSDLQDVRRERGMVQDTDPDWY